jgi:ABC-type glycerol-3-phosphate transport system permease component
MIKSRIRYKTTYVEKTYKKQKGAIVLVLLLNLLFLVIFAFAVTEGSREFSQAGLIAGALQVALPLVFLLLALARVRSKHGKLFAYIGIGLFAFYMIFQLISALFNDSGAIQFLFLFLGIAACVAATILTRTDETAGRKLNRSFAGNAFLFTFMAICGVFMAMPLVMLTNNALKPLDEIFQFPPRIFVRYPSFENFTDLFVSMSETWVPFTRYIFNSSLIMIASVFGHVIIASFAAYPLAKHKFPGKKLLFTLVVLSLMFTWQVTQIPNYVIISFLGINNTYLALIIPAWGYGIGLYLMKQFMEQIPDSLIESARIDGAGEVRTFWRIIMPNVKPAWLTLAIFQFNLMWGNTGYLFLRSEELKPLQFAMQQIAAGGAQRAGEAAAVSFILAAIPITFFLICQSSILETMTTSGMKE